MAKGRGHSARRSAPGRVGLGVVALGLMMGGCAHAPPVPPGCHVESGWLDATNGCSARAGYPDCYRVCPDGTRVRVQNLGKPAPAPQAGAH